MVCQEKKKRKGNWPTRHFVPCQWPRLTCSFLSPCTPLSYQWPTTHQWTGNPCNNVLQTTQPQNHRTQKKKYNQAKKKSKKQKEIYHHHVSTVLSTSSSNAPRSKASLQQDIQTATEALAKDPNNSELLYARGISAISLSRDVTNPNYWGEVNDETSWLNGLADLQRAHQLRYFQGK